MRISLVNMPLAPLPLPTLALTQLKSRLDTLFSQEELQTDIHYLNLEFTEFFGIENYNNLASNDYSTDCNFIEWYFRQEAFPDLPDNKEAYFERYRLDMKYWFRGPDPKSYTQLPIYVHRSMLETVNVLARKRQHLGNFLDHLIKENRLDEADIVGFTSMFQTCLPCYAMARRIKMHNPDARIIIGGANCESPMGEQIVKHIEAIDYVFSGSALISLPEFVGHYLGGRYEQCDRIDGVFSKSNVGTVGSLGRELNINELIELDYDGFMEKAIPILGQIDQKPTLLFETARGCWWGAKSHCTFCGLNGSSMAFRAMEPETAIRFLTPLFRKYASRTERFNCVDNIMPREYPTQVFDKMEVPEELKVFYEVKSDLKLRDMRILKEKGIDILQPGIEALDSSILKLMRKGVTSTQNIKTLRNAALAGIRTYWNLIFGFPGETEDTYVRYLENLPALFHLTPPDVMSTVRFDRYSPYHMQAKEYGLDLKPMDVYSYLYPDLGEKVMMDLVYYFQDRTPDAEYQILSHKYFGKLLEIHKKWRRRWNNHDDLEIPEVYLIKDQSKVCDSRTGEVIMHYLTDCQVQILAILNEPSNPGKLRNAIDKKIRDNLDRDLQVLLDKHLVFHDNMKSFISLVFDFPIRADRYQYHQDIKKANANSP